MNFFQIPKWLIEKSNYIENLMEDINKFEIGSKEWVDAMSEEYPLNIGIPKTEEINSYEDFIKIKECCDFLEYVENVEYFDLNTISTKYIQENGYPITLYVYALINYDKVVENLKLELNNAENKINTSYKKMEVFYELIKDYGTYFI